MLINKTIYQYTIMLFMVLVVLAACTPKQTKKQTTATAPINCEQALQSLIVHSSLKSPFKDKLRANVDHEEEGVLTIQLVDPASSDQTVG